MGKKKRVEFYMCKETYDRLIIAASELNLRGLNSKKRRIRRKVLKSSVTYLIEKALRSRVEDFKAEGRILVSNEVKSEKI